MCSWSRRFAESEEAVQLPVDKLAEHHLVLLLHSLADGGFVAFGSEEVLVAQTVGREDRSPDEEVGDDDRVLGPVVLGLDVKDAAPMLDVMIVSRDQCARTPPTCLPFSFYHGGPGPHKEQAIMREASKRTKRTPEVGSPPPAHLSGETSG